MKRKTIKYNKKNNKTRKYKKNKKGGTNNIKSIETNDGILFRIVYNNGERYFGHWNTNDNKKYGKGTMSYLNGEVYSGDWNNDFKKGNGVMFFNNGEEHSGEWDKDKMINGEISKNGIVIKRIQNGNEIEKIDKPPHLKSPASTIQLNGTCVAHTFARSLTRTLLILTIIDGTMTDEIYIVLYCLFLKVTPANKVCQKGYSFDFQVANNFLEKFKYSIETGELYNYKYSDIPCDFIMGSCDIKKTSDKILNIDINKRQKIFEKYDEVIDFVNVKLMNYNYNLDGKNLPPKEIKDALKIKLQPCIEIQNCFTNTDAGHAFILRSWGKEYDELNYPITVENNRFCYKNTWESSKNICIDDIKDLCKSLDNNSTSKNFEIVFLWFNIELEEMKNNISYEIYSEIEKRINELYPTVYEE